MYHRAARFRKGHTATPARVGPATYYLSDIFDKKAFESCAPFNSSQIRTSAFENTTSAQYPSPNKHKISFRKLRIVGGTSMQNKAPRIRYKSLCTTRGPYPSQGPKWLKGKLHVGVPPRKETSKKSTIPEKGAEGYDMTSEGLVKIWNPSMNKAIGPAAYYKPEGHHNFTTLKYKGNFWSERTAERFRDKVVEGPSPAEYSIDRPSPSPWQQYQDLLQSRKKANAPLLRASDVMLRKLCKELLPGPGSYSPSDQNIKRCECGKFGTFSKAERKSWYQESKGPGPANYKDPRTALDKVSKFTSLKQSPFNVDANRFPQTTGSDLPGPGDYSPPTGMWHDVMKRTHSKYSKWNAPFDSSACRSMSVIKPDSCLTPGPAEYFPRLQKGGDQNKSFMFAGAASSAKGVQTQVQKTPGPAAYSTSEPYKLITKQKSHLQTKNSAFLMSSERLQPLGRSSSPGPSTYNLPESTLDTNKGCTIGSSWLKTSKDKTPGPADYKVHPKYAKSSVFNTHNVTMQAPETKTSNRERKCLEKKLKFFSAKKCLTAHCP